MCQWSNVAFWDFVVVICSPRMTSPRVWTSVISVEGLCLLALGHVARGRQLLATKSTKGTKQKGGLLFCAFCAFCG